MQIQAIVPYNYCATYKGWHDLQKRRAAVLDRTQKIRNFKLMAKKLDWIPNMALQIDLLKAILVFLAGRHSQYPLPTRHEAEILLSAILNQTTTQGKTPRLSPSTNKRVKLFRKDLHPDYLKRANTTAEKRLISKLDEAIKKGKESLAIYLILEWQLSNGKVEEDTIAAFENCSAQAETAFLEELLFYVSTFLEIQSPEQGAFIINGLIKELKALVETRVCAGIHEEVIAYLFPEDTRENIAQFLRNLGVFNG